MTRRLTLLPLGVLLLSASLVAQVSMEPRIGPFSTTGLGFVLPGAANELWHYRGDEQVARQFAPIAATGVVFSHEAILQQLGPQARAAVEIDAMSTGNDLIPVSFTATQARIEQRVAQLTWSALFFSLRRDSVSPTGPMPMSARAAMGGAGADLYSWITPGSVPLGGLEDQVFLDVPAEVLGLARDADITAIDVPMALMVQHGGAFDPLFTPNRNRVFFSVTKASAVALQGMMPGISDVDVSGATIFTTTWDGSAWGAITVAKHPFELGLQGAAANSAADDDELDALAIDSTLLSPLVIFSVRAPSPKPQLMALRGAHGPFELLDENGDPIQGVIGDSDIDAVCGIDPEMGLFSRWLGTPYHETAHPPLITSATQMFAASTGLLTLVMDVHGGPAVDAEVSSAGPLLLQVAPVADVPTWITTVVLPSWDGTGSRRHIEQLGFHLHMDVQFRAVWAPVGGPPVASSRVFSRL